MRECLHYRVSKNMLSNIEEMKLISSCASMLSSLKVSLKWKVIAAYLKTFFKIRVRWHISGTKFEKHCFIICRDILYSAFNDFSCKPYDVITFLICIIKNVKLSLPIFVFVVSFSCLFCFSCYVVFVAVSRYY